jgi:hypothetical protein
MRAGVDRQTWRGRGLRPGGRGTEWRGPGPRSVVAMFPSAVCRWRVRRGRHSEHRTAGGRLKFPLKRSARVGRNRHFGSVQRLRPPRRLRRGGGLQGAAAVAASTAGSVIGTARQADRPAGRLVGRLEFEADRPPDLAARMGSRPTACRAERAPGDVDDVGFRRLAVPSTSTPASGSTPGTARLVV